MENRMSPRQVCARLGIACFALMLTWLALVMAAQLVLTFVAPDLLNNIWVLWLLNDVPLYCAGLPVFLFLLKKIPNGADPERQKMNITPLRLLQIFVACLGLAYIANFATTYINAFLESLIPNFNALSNLDIVFGQNILLPNLIFAALVPAVGEEFIFRYLVHKKLRGASDKTYILLSGLLFGLFHASFSQIPYAVVIGMVLAWVYTQTRNILYPMGIHFTINFISAVLLPKLLENVDLNLDMDALMEMAETGEVAELGPSYLIISLIGLLVIVVAGCAIALCIIHHRHIALSLRPPAEPGWPYKPPRASLIDRRRARGAEGYNPYSQGNWTMPPPEDEVQVKPSPLPDYSRAMQEYRSQQELARAEQNYDYLGGVPYQGPKGGTLENLPLKGWAKTCLLNYGMLSYIILVLAYMALTLLLLVWQQ